MRSVIPMVVEDAQRFRGPHRVTVQVCEHLLRALQPAIQKEDDRDALVSEIRILPQRVLDGRPTVLSIVDEELRLHRNMERSNLGRFRAIRERLELNFPIQGCRERRKAVALAVRQDVVGEVRQNARDSEPAGARSPGTSSASLNRKTFGDEPERAHRDVVLATGPGLPGSQGRRIQRTAQPTG